MSNLLRAALTILLLISAENSFADFMTPEFIQKHQVVLAQFMAHEKLSKEEMLRLDVTLATVKDNYGDTPIQFYLIYRPATDFLPARYYYLIDKNMKASWPLLNAGLYGDEQIVPHIFLPQYLEDDSAQVIVNGKAQPDRFAYFGEINPIDVEFNELVTANNYKIEIRHYGFNGPQNMQDSVGNSTKVVEYLKGWGHELSKKLLEGMLFRSVYYPTGYIMAEDLITREERAEKLAQQEIQHIKQLDDADYIEAMNELIARVNTYRVREMNAEAKIDCVSKLKQIKDFINNPRSK